MTLQQVIKLRILELCDNKEITINKLATICGITQSTLNNIINNRNKSVTVSTIKKICDGLDITLSEFFNTADFINLEQEIQ